MSCPLGLLALLAARLVLNELMVRPLSGGAEWIEILNAGDEPAPLAGLGLEDARGRPALLGSDAGVLDAGAFLLLASNRDRVLESFPLLDPARVVKPGGTWPTFNDSDGDGGFADIVLLRSADGARLDSVAYPARWLGGAGQSVERIDPAGPSTLPANWSPSVDPAGATPLRPNSLALRPEDQDQGELVLPRAPVVPGGEGAPIGWHLPRPGRVAIELFDLEGRSVRLLRPLEVASTVGRVVWDGRDAAGRHCAPGLYIVLLEGRYDDELAPRRWKRAVVVGGRP
jgi:hypothetical protein